MKKILILTCCFFIFFNAAPAQSASCANGAGVLVNGVNGTEYCVSKITMNWWTAFAWCNKVKDYPVLASIHEDCDCTGYEGCDTSVGCPNLKVNINDRAWTSTPASKEDAHYVQLSTGEINPHGLGYWRRVIADRAICKKK